MREKTKTTLVLAVCMTIAAVAMFLPKMSGAASPVVKKLDKIPPTWSQKLPASERFELVLEGEGVLDKETGLVWEQSPSQALWDWNSALEHCYNLEVGGRKGWHLPIVEQLTSLVDKTNPNPTLPSGHPFDTDCLVEGCVHSGAEEFYWSATTSAVNTTFALDVTFFNGILSILNKGNSTEDRAWCVRGGQSYDGY